MSRVSDARDGDHDVIGFAWDAGGGGTLRITWRDGAVAGLTVTFDADRRERSRARDLRETPP